MRSLRAGLRFGRVLAAASPVAAPSFFLAAFALVGGGCVQETVVRGPASTAPPPIAYNPYIPSRTFANAGTFSGYAYYQYRANGYGEIQDGGARFQPTTWSNGATYSFTVNGSTISYVSTGTSRTAILQGIAAAVGSFAPAFQATATAADVRVSPRNPVSAATFGASVSGGSLVAHAAPRPIRYAEVRVYDSAGNLVQGAETESNGFFSFELPRNTGTYSIEVTARANNAAGKVYVMKSPNTNEYHSVRLSGVSSASGTSGLVIVAPADGAIPGGAFNILDQMIKANDFLRTQTANCSSVSDPFYFPNCASGFTVPPLLYVYWDKGVNPGSYFGNSSPVSFYLLGSRQLYLLCQGTDNSGDCDHFDNSVILHEYGHFIEDTYARPDSPGGSHNGNSIIDPRLAWGEGWANFFQAAVTGVSQYVDSKGNIDCVLLDGSSNCYGNQIIRYLDSLSPGADVPAQTGEGIFHEFSVSRVLWRALDAATYAPSAPTTHSTSKFSELWTVLTSPTYGFANSSRRFRNMGLFNKIQASMSGAANWTTVRTSEKQAADLTYYGAALTAPCVSGGTFLPIVRGLDASTDLEDSNQFRNNAFFRYDHSGGTATIQLQCSTNCSGANSNDLDLYLWKDGYVFADGASLVAASATTGSSNESFSVSLAPGTYMLNVNVDTRTFAPVGTTSSYSISINGQQACPSP